MAVDLSMPVLVVDDVSATAATVAGLFQQLGFSDVAQATEGAAALARLRQGHFGLVVADMHMQPMNGQQLLREIRADPQIARTRVMLMAADAKTEHVLSAKRAGVDCLVMKPFDSNMLRDKLLALFGR